MSKIKEKKARDKYRQPTTPITIRNFMHVIQAFTFSFHRQIL